MRSPGLIDYIMKKLLLTGLLVGVLAISSFTLANAAAFDWHVNLQDAFNSPATIDAAPDTGQTSFLGNDITHGGPAFYDVDGISLVGDDSTHRLSVGLIGPSQVDTLNASLADLDTRITTNTSSLSTLSSSLSSLYSTVFALGAPLDIAAFMGNNASTSPFIASSTKNGFLSTTDKSKLDAIQSWSWASPSRSIVTGTGATGFQVSSTRNATVRENVTVTTTASIAGNAGGYIALEMAPTNSATAGDWVEVGRCGNSQALTLAITLQSVQGTTCELTADVPAGYYSKLRSVTTTGTVSFAFVSAQEVLK